MSSRRSESARTRRTVALTVLMTAVFAALVGYLLGSAGLEPTSWQTLAAGAAVALVASVIGLSLYVSTNR